MTSGINITATHLQRAGYNLRRLNEILAKPKPHVLGEIPGMVSVAGARLDVDITAELSNLCWQIEQLCLSLDALHHNSAECDLMLAQQITEKQG
ncbi:hypothetical protein KJY77_01110 [Canibacter sp. lx-72]|uniref:hypothetical protein n=1 Tax=Canibacter zhuwentaonis TaxID=2837491 RepID=UPI001BDD73E1|nr:hypothetical protein [Canibacter zhuwentaonis]MBT1017742.1 hypothetical protein [Canibacter zhuwentaonis]MBT1034898.1 hypothetical protein [Canibacter zhuwentaonis]